MGTAVGVLAVGLLVAVVGYFALRGDNEVVVTPTPVASAVLTSTATIPSTATSTATPRPSATPQPSPTLAAGRRAVPAPIQSVKVEPGTASPRTYTVTIVASLPNGCATRYTQDIKREGDVFIVTILNSEPTGNVPCTAVASTYEVRVTIGESLEAGRTYTVRVNGKDTTFKG